MRNRVKWIIAGALALSALLAGGGLLWRHFNQPTDWPFMENPAGPMLSLLNSQWTSEDGVWSAEIDTTVHPCTLYLRDQQDLVYSGGFTFDFNQYESDLNDRTELVLDDRQFESEGRSVSSTIERLYVENRRLYLDITVSKEGTDSTPQQVVLDRAEDDQTQPAQSESPEIKEVSEMAELMKFSWYQSAMSHDCCFDFTIKFTECDPNLPRLQCDFTDPENGERIKLGVVENWFQGVRMDGTRPSEGETWPSVPIERWEELADYLRKADLRPYTPPPPGLMDATMSCINVTWRDGGKTFTNRCSGFGDTARELEKLLQDIAKEAKDPPAPAPEAPAVPDGSWLCSCGAVNEGKFCRSCGQPKPADAAGWTCSCGTVNEGRFCTECGQPQPAPATPAGSWTCFCGTVNEGKFCTECGAPMETHYKKFFGGFGQGTGMMDDREAKQLLEVFQRLQAGDRSDG